MFPTSISAERGSCPFVVLTETQRHLGVGGTPALCLRGLVARFQLSASLSRSPVRLEDA